MFNTKTNKMDYIKELQLELKEVIKKIVIESYTAGKNFYSDEETGEDYYNENFK